MYKNCIVKQNQSTLGYITVPMWQLAYCEMAMQKLLLLHVLYTRITWDNRKQNVQKLP